MSELPVKNDVGSWSWGEVQLQMNVLSWDCSSVGLESEPEEEVQVAMAHGHYLLQHQAQWQCQQQCPMIIGEEEGQYEQGK